MYYLDFVQAAHLTDIILPIIGRYQPVAMGQQAAYYLLPLKLSQ